MAIALINDVTAASPAGGGSFTTGAKSFTGANFLIALRTEYTGAAVAAVLTDSTGANTWQPLAQVQVGGQQRTRFYYAENASVSGTQTFTLTGTAFFGVLNVLGFDTIATSSSFYGQENGASSGGATNLNTGSITTSGAGHLVVGGWSHGDATATTMTGVTKVNETAFVGGQNYGGAIGWTEKAVAGAINPNGDWSPGSVLCSAVVAAFAVGAAGGATLSVPIVNPPLVGAGLTGGIILRNARRIFLPRFAGAI